MSPGDGVSSLVCFFLFEANRAASQFRLWRIEPHRVATRSFMLFFLLLTALSFFQTDQPPYRWCRIRMHPLPPQTSPTSRRRKRLSLSLQEGHSTRLDWSRNRSRCDCLHLLGFAVRRCCKSTLVFLVVWVKQARTGLTFSPFDLLPPLLPFFFVPFPGEALELCRCDRPLRHDPRLVGSARRLGVLPRSRASDDAFGSFQSTNHHRMRGNFL